MKIFNRVVYLGCAFLILLASVWLYESETGDFRKSNIVYDLDYQPNVSESPPFTPQIEQILNQKFNWLDHGHQVFVFESEDKNYVLKIFKFKKLRPTWFDSLLQHIPFMHSYAEYRHEKRLRRLDRLFKGYNVAFKYDKEHTGILYVHLLPSHHLHKKIIVQDRLGFSHKIHLDKIIFAIQERAKKTKDVLIDLLDKGEISKAKERIGHLLEMYKSEYAKGIIDLDHNIIYNTGFIGDRPMRLDVGRLTIDERMKEVEYSKSDIENITEKRLYPWIKKHYPEVDF